MRVRSKVTGEEIDLDDAAAKELIDAGIYEASTKVSPMTTDDMPNPPRRGRPPKAA